MTQAATGDISALRTLLDSEDCRAKLKEVAADPSTVEREVRIAIRELSGNASVRECSPASIQQTAIDAVALGLSFSKALGEAAAVPFKDRNNKKHCQLIIMYRGLLKLARNSDEILSINCDVVLDGEEFQHEWRDDGPHLLHRVPMPRGKADVIGAWAMATLRGGGRQLAVMDADEINAIRDKSPGYRFDPSGSVWSSSPGEMQKKTAIRRLFKLLPVNTRPMRLAMEHESRVDELMESLDLESEPPKRGIEGAKAKLAAKNGAAMTAQAPPPADDEVPFDPADAPQTAPVDAADEPKADPAMDLIEFASTQWGVALKLAETRLEDHSMRFGKKPLRERSPETLAGFYKQVASGALEYREPRSRATPQPGSAT